MVEVPGRPVPCFVPAWPEIPDDPPWTGPDAEGNFTMTPAGLGVLGAVLESIAAWRDAVAACPGIREGGITAAFRPGFTLAGVPAAISATSRELLR